MKKSKISKYILSLIAISTISCSSLSFGVGIYEAIEKNNITRIMEILGDKKFNINKVNQYGLTPLHWACRYNPGLVELFLKIGANVNAIVQDGAYKGLMPINLAFIYNPRLAKKLLAYIASENKITCKNNPKIYKLLPTYLAKRKREEFSNTEEENHLPKKKRKMFNNK